jgi:CheY-like chemotaxis protein
VLVVDDERLIADTIAQVLNRSGFEATPIYSGGDALDRARVHCPDIVITDVLMPELNGIELARLCAERCPETQILLLSGQAATAAMIERARAEGLDFKLLAKPLHPEDLLDALRRLGF